MVLHIDSKDEAAMRAILELVQKLKVPFQIEEEGDSVSMAEKERRVKAIRKLKGGLHKYNSGYQPEKHDWYQQ